MFFDAFYALILGMNYFSKYNLCIIFINVCKRNLRRTAQEKGIRQWSGDTA